MHEAARAWIEQVVKELGLSDAPSVLDLGGRDVNGTIHSLFSAPVLVLDIRPGPGVDIVADAADWKPDGLYDVVLCTEVFEHTPRWRSIIATARAALASEGFFIATMASRERPPHSAIDGGPLEFGEFYKNIDPEALKRELVEGWDDFEIVEADGYFGNDDLYCWAVK